MERLKGADLSLSETKSGSQLGSFGQCQILSPLEPPGQLLDLHCRVDCPGLAQLLAPLGSGQTAGGVLRGVAINVFVYCKQNHLHQHKQMSTRSSTQISERIRIFLSNPAATFITSFYTSNTYVIRASNTTASQHTVREPSTSD